MAETVGYDVTQGVAVLTLGNPPVNALTRGLRSQIMDAVDRAEEDERVAAIVLIGAGQTFPAGADIMEYQHGLEEPHLRDVCERVAFSESLLSPLCAALCSVVVWNWPWRRITGLPWRIRV